MKMLNKYILIVLTLLFACVKEEVYIEPIAKIKASRAELAINENVTFSHEGQGQKITIFTGKKGEQYIEDQTLVIDNPQVGIELTRQQSSYTTSYTESGEYTAVIVATGYEADGSHLTRAVDSLQIVVTDTTKTIESIRISMEKVKGDVQSIYTIFYPPRDVFLYNYEVRPDGNGNVVIPVHSLSNPNWMLIGGTSLIRNIDEFKIQPMVVGKSKSLSYDIDGIDTEFLNDGSQLVNHVENGEFVPRAYNVINNNEHVNTYFVCPMTLPYFKSFTLKDIQGVSYSPKFKINLSDYTKSELQFTIPDGVDLSKLIPEYETNVPGVEVAYTNDGNPEGDYSQNGEIRYQLKFTRTKKAEDTYSGEMSLTANILTTVNSQ